MNKNANICQILCSGVACIAHAYLGIALSVLYLLSQSLLCMLKLAQRHWCVIETIFHMILVEQDIKKIVSLRKRYAKCFLSSPFGIKVS